jgi:integrase
LRSGSRKRRGAKRLNQLEEYFYTVKSDRSKELYKEYIKYFSEFSQLTLIDLLKLPQKDIQDTLQEYVISLRDKKLSYASIKGRMSPIIAFLELNDILVNKKRIKSFYPEERKTVRDEAYSTEQIQTMLSQAKLRVKVMILVYSSTGMRRNAIIDLKMKHLKKIPEYGIYRLTVYENSEEEYITFTTPEASNMIDQYLKHREQSGEVINKQSYLIRNDFDYFRQDVSAKPEPVTSWNLNTLFRGLAVKTGLRTLSNSQYSRYETPLFHGFRKFFTNKLIESGVTTEHRFLLEGHALKGNDSAYVRISEKQLLEEYLKAINNLTISDEERLKFKLEERIQIEKTQYQSLKDEFDKFKAELLNQRK